MPLVWGRWTSHLPIIGKKIENPPMISSVALVFFISGFWHGSTMPFVFWGCMQAAFRVGEELLHRFYKKPAKRPKLALRVFKTMCVFCLWAASLVFFRVGTVKGAGVADGFSFLIRQFQNLSLPQFAADTFAIIEKGFYTKNIMVIGYLVFLLFVLSIGLYTDWLQCFKYKDKHISLVLATQKTSVRWICYYGLLLLTFAALVMQSGGFGTSSFAYGGF